MSKSFQCVTMKRALKYPSEGERDAFFSKTIIIPIRTCFPRHSFIVLINKRPKISELLTACEFVGKRDRIVRNGKQFIQLFLVTDKAVKKRGENEFENKIRMGTERKMSKRLSLTLSKSVQISLKFSNLSRHCPVQLAVG